MPDSALIFANGAVNDGYFVQEAIKLASEAVIIAADGGANLAHDHYHLTPHVVIGDMDSVRSDLLRQLQANGAHIARYAAEKNETDLELALLWALEQDINWIYIVGGLGRRMDQTLGNIYLLALPQLASCKIRYVDGDQQMWLTSPGQIMINGEKGDTLSLIPLRGDVQGISTENLYYPLNDETLKFGPARGISNVLTAPQATVTHTDGLLFIVHTKGRAE